MWVRVWAHLSQVLWLRDVREAAFLVSARVRVSSEGLTGEGSISTPMWFLAAFSFLQAVGLRALVPCGMLASGYVQFLAPGASPTQLIASSPQWARESACHRPTSPNPLSVHFSEPCHERLCFYWYGRDWNLTNRLEGAGKFWLDFIWLLCTLIDLSGALQRAWTVWFPFMLPITLSNRWGNQDLETTRVSSMLTRVESTRVFKRSEGVKNKGIVGVDQHGGISSLQGQV